MELLSRTPRHLNFYPGDCRQQIQAFLADYRPPQDLPPRLTAAAVPHAGWRYSGGVACRTVKTLAGRCSPRHVLALGAVHRAPLTKAALYPTGRWETPLGPVNVDGDLARELLEKLPDLVTADSAAHDAEHSLEVQMPFFHEFFPGVPVLPVLIPPHASPVLLGTRLAWAMEARETVVVASTDLTHYGEVYGFDPVGFGPEAHEWMRANDRRILDIAARMEAEQIPPEARQNANACGAGALAAAVAFARELGAKRGSILEHTDSYEVEGGSGPFRMAVGYAGMVF